MASGAAAATDAASRALLQHLQTRIQLSPPQPAPLPLAHSKQLAMQLPDAVPHGSSCMTHELP